jgi:hypothetical protein
MSNGPISVSAPGKSLRDALGSDITFNTRHPFAKLDTTNKVSFQNINIFFANDPPNPNGTTQTSLVTTVYQFKHGYKYIPALWCIYQRTGFGVQNDFSSTKFGPYGYENGTFCVSSASDTAQYAELAFWADETYVYIGINKHYQTDAFHPDPPVNLLGYSLLLRVYAFVNDLSGTDVPSHA